MARSLLLSLASVCALSFAVSSTASAAPLLDDVVKDEARDAGKPPVFTDLSLADALARNAEDGRILVVKATAVWCGPCKRMDATTWREEPVVDWIRAKGTAISLDVDRHREDAQRLRIRAMPTIVAFRAGEEVDRAVGYQSGENLLKWLAAVEAGETTQSRLDAKLAAPREGDGALGMQDRMTLARELADAGRVEAATEEYAWLWTNMLRIEPAMHGVRLSFLSSAMQQFAKAHGVALQRFTTLRDETAAQIEDGDSTGALRADWIALNDMIDDSQATLAWFDGVKGELGANPGAMRRLGLAQLGLTRVLEEHERWADLGRLETDPVAQITSEARSVQMMLAMENREVPGQTPEMAAQTRDQMRDRMRKFALERSLETAGRLHAILLAADRVDEARRVAIEAIRLESEDPERMAQSIVAFAIRAGVADEMHRELLVERPLPESVRETYGNSLPERLTDQARAAERAKAIEALERATRTAG